MPQVLYKASCDGECLVMQVKRTGETGGRHEDIVAVRNEGPLQTENFQTAKQGDTVGLSWVENDPRKHISKQGRSLR